MPDLEPTQFVESQWNRRRWTGGGRAKDDHFQWDGKTGSERIPSVSPSQRDIPSSSGRTCTRDRATSATASSAAFAPATGRYAWTNSRRTSADVHRGTRSRCRCRRRVMDHFLTVTVELTGPERAARCPSLPKSARPAGAAFDIHWRHADSRPARDTIRTNGCPVQTEAAVGTSGTAELRKKGRAGR